MFVRFLTDAYEVSCRVRAWVARLGAGSAPCFTP